MSMAKKEETSSLPLSLVARIMSFNIGTTMDVAKLRLVGKNMTALLPSFHDSCRGDLIAPPPKRCSLQDNFITQVCRADGYWYDGDLITPAEEWTFDPDDVEEYALPFLARETKEEDDEKDRDSVGCEITKCVFLAKPTMINPEDDPSFGRKARSRRKQGKPEASSKPKKEEEEHQPLLKRAKPLTEEEMCEVMGCFCGKLHAATTSNDILALYEQIKRQGLMEPVGEAVHPKKRVDIFFQADNYPAFVAARIPKKAACIKKIIQTGGNTKTFLHLQANPTKYDDESEGPTLVPAQAGHLYRALVVSDDEECYHVELFMDLASSYTRINETAEDFEGRKSVVFDEVLARHQNHTLVEGVAVVDGPVSNSFANKLNILINDLAKKQEEVQEEDGVTTLVDYHPHSNDVVRDLVHPALFAFVRGVTPLCAKVEDVQPCIFPTLDRHGDSDKSDSSKDFWGRPYESSVYQWLPTYFNVSMDGSCMIEDYINNLVPREHHSDLYKGLETLFCQALPYIESVYSYVRGVERQLLPDDVSAEWRSEALDPIDTKCVSLRGQKLQVITKIVDYELSAGQIYEGVWHVEGMSHEEIVLTCLYILDRDDELEGGAIEYKRAFLQDEADKLMADVPQVRHGRLVEIIREGLVPLGRVETNKGRLVVFPNSHVHRVCPILNKAKEGAKCRRRIVVFFLVNPLKRIVSTREVVPQQVRGGGSMKLEEAKLHRLELMKERKYTKQDWNVREVELCEH